MSSEQILDVATSASQDWDVIIVGGGMGGGSTAYSLAKQGFKVLLIEKGKANFESAVGVEIEQEAPEERLENGKWPKKISAQVDGKLSQIWAPLGCGLGGSTLLYAAALQRLDPEDFKEQTTPNGGSVVWPFSYQELEPYYLAAEKLFSVRGTPDPLEKNSQYNLAAPPAMCERDQHYFQEFKQAGLHPYRLHVAMKYANNCGECGGLVCKIRCKQDSLNACIEPGLATGNLFVLSECEVLKLNSDGKQVSSVLVHQGENEAKINAKVIVLSAGAFFTPILLKKSRTEAFPKGLANRSDLVGKNLMFHASDFIAFWPKSKYSRLGPNKTISLRDYYHGETKMGEFQSTGLQANFHMVLYALRLLFDQSVFKKISPLRHILRVPAYLASKLYGDATVFTTIVEDFPYQENCVVVDESQPSGMRFEYTIHDEFRERVMQMRSEIRQRLSSLRSILMNVGVSLNYGHPCGTCKSGDDPTTSVIDRNCKAHDLDNLYIVDSSFMPTSGGTNPSLTIAANALRVAEKIAEKIKQV